MKPFNMMAIFWVERDRLYRAYADAETLYLIRIGGQFAYKQVQPNPGLGLAGAIPAAIAMTERMLPPETIAQYDQTPPREVFGQHKHDRAFPLEDIASASLIPVPFFCGHGRHWARFLVTRKNGTKWTFQFVKRADAEAGFEQLPPFFGEKLKVKLRWDEKRKMFVSVS